MIKRPLFKLQVILFLLLVLAFSVFPSSWFLSQSLASTSRKRFKLVLALSVVSMEISGCHESQFSNKGWTPSSGTNLVTARVKFTAMNSHILPIENNIWWGKWYILGSIQQRHCDCIPSTICRDKQTNKHKGVGQVKLLPMKHSWEGKKGFNGT